MKILRANLSSTGNEDWINQAPETWPYRYPAFRDAIAKEFPQLLLVASSPYNFTGQAAIDQHDYNSKYGGGQTCIVTGTLTWSHGTAPNYFISQYDRMDEWPRNGTLIYEWEFAVINSGLTNDDDIYNGPSRLRHPTLIGALAEGVFMLGAERNGDLCHGAAYAPIFMNEGSNATQWTPDLISFNAKSMVKSTSYYVQQAFGESRIANIHEVKASVAPKKSKVFHSVGTNDDGSELIVKLINTKSSSQKVSLALSDGSKKISSDGASLWQMSGNDAQGANTLSNPRAIVPTQGGLPEGALGQDGKLKLTLPAYSFTIVKAGLA